MKNKGAIMEYSRERLDDLMRVYDEYLSSYKHIRMPELYSNIVNKPSRRFWVSDIRASLVISAMIRGESHIYKMQPLKKEMYQEIYNRVMALRKRRPQLTISQLCSIVIAQPAPKFYLTPGSAKIMICKARREWTKRKLARLLRL